MFSILVRLSKIKGNFYVRPTQNGSICGACVIYFLYVTCAKWVMEAMETYSEIIEKSISNGWNYLDDSEIQFNLIATLFHI